MKAKAAPFRQRIYINDGGRSPRNFPSAGHTDVLESVTFLSSCFSIFAKPENVPPAGN